jgi:TonB family protein
MKMLEMSQSTATTGRRPSHGNHERRRLLIALALLLFALGVVLVKDRDFWFGSDEAADQPTPADMEKARNALSQSNSLPAATHPPVAAVPSDAANKTTAKNTEAAGATKEIATVAPKAPPVVSAPPRKEIAAAKLPAVPSKRAVLPPLKVDVVARHSQHPTASGSNAAKAEARNASNHAIARATSASSLSSAPATNASEHEHITPKPAELRQTLDAAYPLLGQHMSVQGSVVLQAVVGANGVIENLRVLSGPAILSAAAQQAVRQWRFKPVLQNGQAVETKATITVNFSIHVSDTPANAS